MKKNIIKSITLSSLLILTSCNSTSYKYDEPLFITGDIADDSVKNNFFEKTKNYSNFIPDGCYEYTYTRKINYYGVYNDEIVINIKMKVRNIINSKTGKSTYTLDKLIYHYKANDDAKWYNKNYNPYREIYKYYDGNTYTDNEIAVQNISYPSYKHYYTNIKNPTIDFSHLNRPTQKDLIKNDYVLYSKNNIYHFEYSSYKDYEYINSIYYNEDIAFEFNSDFTKLNQLSFNYISFGYYFKDSSNVPLKDYDIGIVKAIDEFEVELPDLNDYELKDNSKFLYISG